jgi:hypothetical protein
MDMHNYQQPSRTRFPGRPKTAPRAVASAASDNSPVAVFGEIGLILATTFGLVTLVQLALVAFHVA